MLRKAEGPGWSREAKRAPVDPDGLPSDVHNVCERYSRPDVIADRWGATAAEVAAGQPCDALAPPGASSADRAISIDAPVAIVFRWLCQLRTAPYSHDWIDNLGRRSPRTLTPGLDLLEPGQTFMKMFRLESFVVDQHLTLRSSGRTVVTYSVAPEGGGTRFVVRVAFAMPRLVAVPLVIVGLVTMGRQLLTLKEYSERDAAGSGVS